MNKKCHYYNKEHSKNIIKKGVNSAGHQRYLCGHCNKCFTETKGSLFYNKKIKEEDVKKICKELAEQKSIREIANETHHHRDTICHLIDNLASNSIQITQNLLCKICKNDHEIEEFWRWVKNRKRVFSKEAKAGLNKIENILKEKI